MVIDCVEEVLLGIHIPWVRVACHKQGFVIAYLVAEITEANLLSIIEPFFGVGGERGSICDRFIRGVKVEERIRASLTTGFRKVST